MASKSSLQRLGEIVKKGDLYPKEFDFTFDNGSRSLKSWVGVLAGAIMSTIILVYGMHKLQILLSYGEVTLMEPIVRHYFDETYSHTKANGFEIAFGLMGWDIETDFSRD